MPDYVTIILLAAAVLLSGGLGWAIGHGFGYTKGYEDGYNHGKRSAEWVRKYIRGED